MTGNFGAEHGVSEQNTKAENSVLPCNKETTNTKRNREKYRPPRPPPASNHERIKVSKRAVAEQGRDLEKLTTTELTGGKFRNCFKQIPCKFKPFSPNGA